MNSVNETALAGALESAHAVIAEKTSAVRERIDELRKRITHITVSRPVQEQLASASETKRPTRCQELETLYSHAASLDTLIFQMDQLIESIDI